ncbi:PD-(D/E)XK nuclease superfamily protein [Flaviramulus basaltis]|uniref:PD-(D/E)XK nuclease superfamily protein n=1 Tax=Flaviramulus basaltis TaxID=369401 RepID=A0A1K2IDA9_9FLAO|nr:PD-(D/E)XK nuclease family protein [Flaviramulus basaltis]SFZ90375.1 PD-(D/E)XK nuclease superfamily protein [Flaviramulus basaltis]
MTTFIFDVLKDLQNNNTNISKITFVLPSKRAGLFLKHQLPKVINQTVFSPEIISIEEFVEEMSKLKSISNTELLFEFYGTYTNLTKEENRDSFESFSKWAQILLQDFNEIDRYLIPQAKIFDYLGAIKEIESNHWSLDEKKTDFVKNYLAFWTKLYNYYNHFTKHLLNKNIGYQGLIYREAVENLESYIQNHNEKQHVFLGFNALNTAEETIIQELLENDIAQVYWDIDAVFINNLKHDAALFTRHHKSKWSFFKNNPFNWISENYSKEKNISIFGIPKNIGQAKYIGEILNNLQTTHQSLQNTAVVLGDENLLIPVLNSLPKSIDALNITMGFPLKSIPLASLFEALFHLHKNASNSFYYKDVINIISHQFIRPLLTIENIDYASKLIETIDTNNLVYLTKDRLKQIAIESSNIIDLLFSNWQKSIQNALNNCSQLILIIKNHLDKEKESNLLSLEYVFRFNELFNELNRLNSEYHHIKDISALYSVYKELLSNNTLDFQGEPLQGLQIMGMLESRVLDFETVIISSVNEGVLPSGKSNNSFIPFDVKIENNLPTYKEKDAVYTYHFYHLLQRAKNVYILYNTEADVLTGGEKSRFITQLELEGIHSINHQIIAPLVPIIEPSLNVIKKTETLQKQIIQLAGEGFSPSSLTNYIRNPIDFYYQKILKIKEHDDVEETVASNTLGTVVHNTLEDFYKPFEGKLLTLDSIKNLKLQIEEKVTFHFKNEYKEGDITKGKNLIIFEIAKRYVSNFLDLEIKHLKAGNTIKIIAIEANNEVLIDIPELNFPIKIRGKVDRVDEYNGVTRIIDYKTGSVQQNQVEIVNWEDLNTDYKKYSKSFQILAYAYMMHASKQISLPIEAGIISFKNLSSGFLKFAKKDKPGNYAKKDMLITQETINNFSDELNNLIKEICNPDIDFTEKEV